MMLVHDYSRVLRVFADVVLYKGTSWPDFDTSSDGMI